MKTAQAGQKAWYDKTAQQQEFQPNDKVSVLLPTSSNKLVAEWQGPYSTVQRSGKVDYIVNTHDRRRKNRVFHVNMLRPWYETPTTSMMAVEVGSSDYEDDISLWREEADDNSPAIGTELEADQKDSCSGSSHISRRGLLSNGSP